MGFDPQFPLLNFIRRASDGVKASLSEILENQDVMLHSSFWQYDSNADGHNSEGLLQLLSGHIEPDDHFYWTLFNFDICEVTGRMCWGTEPSFFVVYDELR